MAYGARRGPIRPAIHSIAPSPIKSSISLPAKRNSPPGLSALARTAA